MLAQVAIGSGAYNFYSFNGKDTVGWSIAGVSTALFFLLLIAQEIRHQFKLRKEVPFVVPEASMKKSEFD